MTRREATNGNGSRCNRDAWEGSDYCPDHEADVLRRSTAAAAEFAARLDGGMDAVGQAARARADMMEAVEMALQALLPGASLEMQREAYSVLRVAAERFKDGGRG